MCSYVYMYIYIYIYIHIHIPSCIGMYTLYYYITYLLGDVGLREGAGGGGRRLRVAGGARRRPGPPGAVCIVSLLSVVLY